MSTTSRASAHKVGWMDRATLFARRRFWLALFLSVLPLGRIEITQAQITQLETFDSDPLARGWRIGGNRSLFAWNSNLHVLDITWDSSKSNSFFYTPMGTILTKAEDFQLTFVLRLKDILVGSTPGKPAEFPIAIGFINRQLTTNQNAFRGAGVSSLYGVRNIVEWNFFPDAGFGDTWATTVISSNNAFAYGHTFPLALDVNVAYRITLAYDASMQRIRTTALRNGQPVPGLEDVSVTTTPDFRLDAVSVSTYSDAVQVGPAAYHGSVLAHGTIEEIAWTVPSSPIPGWTLMGSPNATYAEFQSRSNWVYTLERSDNLSDWRPASMAVPGTGRTTVLSDTNAPAQSAFYRIRAERP